MKNVRIGLFGIGLGTYWPQFPGLKERLEGYLAEVGARCFVNDWNAQGPAHHCAVGVGHLAAKLGKLAQILGIDFDRVC